GGQSDLRREADGADHRRRRPGDRRRRVGRPAVAGRLQPPLRDRLRRRPPDHRRRRDRHAAAAAFTDPRPRRIRPGRGPARHDLPGDTDPRLRHAALVEPRRVGCRRLRGRGRSGAPAVATIRFDNGAIATAEANFSAAYGYDVRGEVFGSAGMVTAGDVRAGDMRHYHAGGVSSPTTRLNIDLFRDAYTQQLADFAANVRGERRPVPTGEDAREALAIALAAIESVRSGARVAIGKVTA